MQEGGTLRDHPKLAMAQSGRGAVKQLLMQPACMHTLGARAYTEVELVYAHGH